MEKIDFVIMMLKEMRLNYRLQYLKKVPDMNFVVNIIEKEVKIKNG